MPATSLEAPMTANIQVAPLQPPPIAGDEIWPCDAAPTSAFDFSGDVFGNEGGWAFGATSGSDFDLAYVSFKSNAP